MFILSRWNGYLFIPIISIVFLACLELSKDNTHQGGTSISYEILSQFTTTAKLHISIENTTSEWTFGLARNGADVSTATNNNEDTTIHDRV